MALLDMHPGSSVDDAVDHRSGNGEVFSNFSLRHGLCHSSDFRDLILVQKHVGCAPLVLAKRDRFEVFGIPAGSIPAKMVDDQSFGHRTNEVLVGNLVEISVSPIESWTTVSVIQLSGVDPASSRFINHRFLEKLIDGVSGHALMMSVDKTGIVARSVVISRSGYKSGFAAASALAKASRNGILGLHSILQRLSATPRLLVTARGTCVPPIIRDWGIA